MRNRIMWRVLVRFATVFVIVTISFLFVRFMPGDPLIHLVGQENYYYLLDAAPATLDGIADRYGLNDSLGEQYVSYLRSIVTFDFGKSHINHRSVLDNVGVAAR